MPLYEYECAACGERFEVIQRFADGPPDTCRKCGGGPMQRLLSAPAIQFKGTGWYITDYARKGRGSEGATVPHASDGHDANGQGANGNGANGNATKPGEKATPTEKTAPASGTTEKAGEKKA